jgi:hypothetical protein
MTLAQKQWKFSMFLARLITWAYDNGYRISMGEGLRTKEQQAIYVKTGKSKTMNSKHLVCLAQDIALWKDNVYLTETPDYAPLGEYWKSLDPECVWGGDWGWDGGHFQYTK